MDDNATLSTPIDGTVINGTMTVEGRSLHDVVFRYPPAIQTEVQNYCDTNKTDDQIKLAKQVIFRDGSTEWTLSRVRQGAHSIELQSLCSYVMEGLMPRGIGNNVELPTRVTEVAKTPASIEPATLSTQENNANDLTAAVVYSHPEIGSGYASTSVNANEDRNHSPGVKSGEAPVTSPAALLNSDRYGRSVTGIMGEPSILSSSGSYTNPTVPALSDGTVHSFASHVDGKPFSALGDESQCPPPLLELTGREHANDEVIDVVESVRPIIMARMRNGSILISGERDTLLTKSVVVGANLTLALEGLSPKRDGLLMLRRFVICSGDDD